MIFSIHLYIFVDAAKDIILYTTHYLMLLHFEMKNTS